MLMMGKGSSFTGGGSRSIPGNIEGSTCDSKAQTVGKEDLRSVERGLTPDGHRSTW